MTDFDGIKICFIDVDGTLTSGEYIISDEGLVYKSFYTRDFFAIEKMMKNDIKVVIITQSRDDIIYQQIDRICAQSFFWADCLKNKDLLILTNIENKKEAIENMLSKELVWDNIAYIGDAENDLECMKLAGWTGCPTDAILEVYNESNYPSDFYGGKGAVYDFCNHILEKRKGKK